MGENKIGLVTDSNSGFMPNEREDILVIPMPFNVNEVEYLEGVNLSREEFYKQLNEDAQIFTSMPSIPYLKMAWDKALETHEHLIYIPMSSALSSGFQTAKILSEDYKGRVYVVDSRRVSAPEKQFVLDAKKLIDEGRDIKDIVQILNKTALDSVIYIALDTLTHLKKGGRVTPAVATVGDLLKIKPIMRFQGGKLDLFKTARTMKKARTIMIKAMENEIKDNFKCSIEDVNFQVAYSSLDDKMALEAKDELSKVYPSSDILLDSLTLSLACHIGPNGVGIAVTKKVK